MRLVLGLYGVVAIAIVAAWSWLGAEVAMPPSLAADAKPYCVSYAPFRDQQTPLDRSTRIDPRQIEEDLTRLKSVTGCIRTYSNDFGLDQVPGIARRLGLTVIQGLWLSSHSDRNKEQIETAVKLAKAYPDVIQALVVGNEALLRGEISAGDLANTIRAVKAQVPVPVTYADVWEFWLRHRDLAAVVDFVTVHILPYWEDIPIGAGAAAAHVEAIRARVAAAFPGKEVLIGESGWPSRGRMREGALPSPANQARVIQEVLAQAQRGNYRVNLIEAFDQPWKRAQEGTVGGYWGLYDDRSRQPKFAWGAGVSNHPHWRWQAAGGVVFATLTFVAAIFGARRRRPSFVPPATWLGIAVSAAAGGICIGWAVESMLIEAFGLGGWLRAAALAAVAAMTPPVAALALSGNRPLPAFAAILRSSDRSGRRIEQVCGWLMIAITVLSLQTALGLAFDPRYRDFPDAALTGALVPLAMLSLIGPRPAGLRQPAESLAAATLALCGVYILFNEGLANWQSVWFCALLAGLAVILRRARAERD